MKLSFEDPYAMDCIAMYEEYRKAKEPDSAKLAWNELDSRRQKEVRDFFQTHSKIALLDQERFGSITCTPIASNDAASSINLGFCIFEKYRQQNYGTQFIQEVCSFLKNEYSGLVISAGIRKLNLAAVKVLENSDFKYKRTYMAPPLGAYTEEIEYLEYILQN